MPLIPIARLILSWVGLLLLATGLYFLWSWWEGVIVLDGSEAFIRVREDWRLWTAVALLGWSLFGRLPTLLVLAKPDTDPTRPLRGPGQMIASPSTANLYVEREGTPDGPMVIASHGWGLDSTIWQYLKRHLATERGLIPHTLVTWDLPGLGRSKAPTDGKITLSRFALDLAELIETEPSRRVILLGHSIGGMTIQTLVRDRPDLVRERVAGVILINTTYTNPLRTMIASKLAMSLRRPLLEPLLKLAILAKPLAWLGAWQGYLNGTAHIANRLQFGPAPTRSQLDHTTLLGTRNPPDSLAKGNLAMFDWDSTGALAEAGCPVLIIGGDLDLVTKLEASQTLHQQSPSAVLESITGANHMGFLERAQHYNRLIVAFISDHGSETVGR